MVFESLVTDVLNNVLGDYVENLDSKQLKIGIWGGDVVLKNLVLKQSALNNLDLPVQAVYGRLSKLVLKIPWKNLYYSSVEASIEGLYLIVEPSQQIQYDAEKEEKRDFDAKQAMLAQIEEARKKKLEPKKQVDDSLVEKLTTQIIRNVQVSIKNIHVRYEDRITNPGHPFTMGVTLSKLIVQTTDSDWVPAVVYDDKAHVKIHKIIDLEGLAVYWNCNSLLYCTLPFDDIVDRLHSEIPTSTSVPEEYNYILGPISSSARVKINPKPEYDTPAFSIPKAIANLEIEKLSLGLTKLQYRDIIAFADSMDLMAKAVIYRKYRPNVPSYKGYYKEWWRFAYKCILEEEILRVRKNWSWSHMKKHRQLLRDYGQAYKMKLQDKKCPPEILSKLTEIEKELDVMNIVLVRQRIQLELERLGKAQEQQQQPSRGWFSSWWSKPEDVQKPTEQSSSLVSQFQAAMTPDEKQRLYNAIDYQENAAAVEFPPYFVENSCIFVLKSLEITLTDEDGEVLNANLEDVKLKVETRPVTSGLSVFVNIHKLMVLGIPQDDLIPELISSQTTEDNASLLDVTFETNPVDSIYGQRLYLVAKPLRVIYDAITINRALDVFKVPQSSALAQLSEATATTISDVKTRSTAGIQYLVDQHVLVDIKIDLYAPYLILPYGGVYRGAENIIVANLGYLKVTSTERLKSTIKEKHLKADADDVFKVLMEESYDKFIIELTQLQILLVPGGEEWMDVMKENKTSPLHLLKPISLFLTFHKCLIDNDPRLAQSKLSGILPSIKMVVSDHQIILLSALMNSIPFPKEEDSPGLKEMDAISVHSEATYTFMDKAASNIKMLELVTADRSSALREASKQKLDTVQFILMQINFIMEEFSVTVNHQEFTGSPFESVAEFSVSNLVLDVCTKTFVNSVTIKLGSLHLLKYHNNAEVEIIGTPICARPGTFLFKVDFVQVDKKCPDFKTTYNCCESMLSFEFALIKIVLHQEVLLELVKFTSDLQVQLEELQNTVDTFRASDFKRRLSSISDTLVVRSSMTTKPQTTKSTVSVSKSAVIETILFKLDAKLTELDLLFANDACDISQIFVKDLNLEVLMKKPYTQVKAVLREIEILDCTPHSIYPKILAIGDEEAINMQIVMYNREPEQVSFTGEDISIQATFGGLHFTFLNVYIATMSSFVDNFQAARAAIIEASQAAADKAKNNVTNIYENATRISLNVRMRAPKIVIPRNSKDYNALYIDLGNLHIANSFIILDIKNERDEPAVIDEIQLKLTDFKLSRIMTNIKRTITNDVTILLPLSFSLNVKRNLSSKWYKAIPEVHIVGQIESIEIHIGQPDYNMILATLNGNLAEGAKVEVQKPSSMVKVEVDQGVLTTASATTIKPCNDLILLDKTDGEIDIVDKNTYIFLKFNFMMNSFVVSLFTIDEKNEDKFSFTTKRHGLARLSLEGFSVKGRILSDNTMNTSVLLVDILLDDIRPGKEHRINRLFSRKVFGYTECLARTVTPFAFKTMVDVTYKKKNDDTYLDVRISSFDLILSMDFLSRVQKFFTAALEEAEGDVDVYAETKAKSTKGSSQSSRLSANVPAPPQSTGSFSFNIQIEQPDIVFVETMRSIDTNCLILNCEILIKLRIDGVRQSVSGTMKDIQMYTCYYNPEKRTNTKGNVLYPFTISIAGATPEGEGLHLEVCLTKMHLRVSPNIIELLNRVYVTMYRSSETAMVQDDTIQDHSQLWDFKPYKESDHWYLRTEVADEVDEDLGIVESKVKKLNEICFVRVPALIITVEAGIGNKTLPMLLMESHFDGKIKNWSSNMVMDATLTFQMGYYNSVLAVWEPLIEPVEDHKDGNDGYKPWELRMYVTINNIEEDTPVISPIAEGEFQEMITPQPRMVIEFTSSSNLEMTVTRTALEVLSALGNAFAEAVSTDTKYDVDIGAPYKVKNETGLNVKILLANSSFQVFNNPTPKEILLASGTEVPLELKPELERGELELNTDMKPIQKYLHLLFVQMNFEVVLNLIRADTRYFSLKYRGEFNNYWGIITQTVVEDGVIEATLSSIVKVYNDLDLPVDIYFMTPRGNELKSIGTIQPGSVFNVPMKAIYTPTNELFFSVPQYCVTNTPFIWKDLQSNVNQTQILLCHPKDEAEVGHSEPFVIKTVGKVEQVFNENTLRYTMASILCKVHLRPAVTFTNSLPVPISVSIQDINEETKLDPGSTIIMHHVNPGNSYIIVRLLTYFEREWSCIKDIPANLVEFSVWTFDSFQGSRKLSIDLGLHCLHENGTLVLALYCPFWMLNKSELNLSYRNSDENLNILLHPANRKDLILFSFNPKNFFGKKKASVRISNGGEWSDKFSIDVAGSSGVVTCKYEGKIYQLGVHIQLTYNNLTKQVTFTPYYVMINSAHFAIECQEFNRPADPWTPVQPNSCAALWPVGDHDDKLLKLRVVGTEEVSAPFFITESHTTLLKLKNKYGGVYVDIQITEGAVYINFFKYDDGLAPVLIINHTKDTLNIWEKETVQLRKLEAGYKFFYTWENPSGDRVLVWEAGYKKEIEDDLRKDGCGEYAVGDNNYVYWVSFLDGMQRVLLFTCDRTVAENAQQAKRFAIIDQEVTLSIHGIGLSLVNNLERREIMYLRIASSGIIWETCKNQGRRYKQLSQKDSNNIEEAYQLYQQRKFFSDEGIGRCVIDAKTEVDFDLNEMYKPHHRKIRRTFLTGLWMQMSTNATLMQLHAKINRLQIDNQMFDCLFPVVLAPVPLPKTVANTDVHRPFAELSIVQLLMKHSQIKQYKYFKVLIQEFHVKLDLAFVASVTNVFPQATQSDLEAEKQKFLLDVDLVNNPLYQHVSLQSQQEQKSFYDVLHFSPLKIHVSFSLASNDTSGQNVNTPNALNVLLQGLGVTLTDMQDVVFKLGFFEREYTFLTQKQLVNEASSHYIGQAIKQLYVLVLGLDVLGNPYGLVLGITKGVEDLFYEPFQGAIQGPGEFAEGLALGVRSLFGHTVGGAAGAVSRITGAMGKGLAALTFDKEYQRKRQNQLNKTPGSVQEGIARSGKGLVMGVYDGITGVVRKPISGAKEEGVGGFIKGLGKGAVGLVTRPTAGVIDFASSSLDTVKRVTELTGEEAQRVRFARYIPADGLITPYNCQNATGYKLLNEMDKGKYSNTDMYVYHYNVIFKKEVLLITDKRIAYIIHNDLFGGWQVNWTYTLQEIVMPPKVVPKGVAITLIDAKKKKTNLFSSSDVGKTILISDRKVCEDICLRISELQKSI